MRPWNEPGAVLLQELHDGAGPVASPGSKLATHINSILEAGTVRLPWTQDRRGKARFVRRIRKTLRLENHPTAERRVAAA